MYLRKTSAKLAGCLLALALAQALDARAAADPRDGEVDQVPKGDLLVPRLLGVQFTMMRQHQYAMRSPYASSVSLLADGDTQSTFTTGVYLGMPLRRNLEAYLDLERFQGEGISNATGLASLTDGDSIRAGTQGLGKDPYIARAYLRYLIPFGNGSQETVRSMDSLPGRESDSHLEIKAGVLAVNDDFDRNRYANATRTQFQNWSLWNNTAWDFAADTRGYTDGAVLAWVSPRWELRLGVYQMPVHANGQELDSSLSRSRGQNLELTWRQPGDNGAVLRLLAYQNVARMGVYRNAIAAAQAQGSAPDITADDQPGRRKHGFGVNLEQPLADKGETGLFLRLGWNNGSTETFAFTEMDRHLSFGGQLDGMHWGRPDDRFAVGIVVGGLSAPHRDYLAAGGLGFVVGDGKLNYGTEQVAEVYYRLQPFRFLQISPDFQYIRNPAYNRDRGPVRVVGFRIHAEY
jgi:high affinity Mn2+ porin